MANAQLQAVLRHIRRMANAQTLAAATDGQLVQRFLTGGTGVPPVAREAAFAALLRRHGPMVLGVCRVVLGHLQDAEDVFQATFLVLARKAGSIRKKESVASWLHGVAYRLAVRAKARRFVRRAHERKASAMRKPGPSVEEAWRELRPLIDEEMEKLPAPYRAALVLCYLEGKTQEQAARELGCPLGTVRSRVARARKLLQERLARRGLTLSVSSFPAFLAMSAGSQAVETKLLQTTLTAALQFAAGKAVAEIVSPPVALLVDGGLKAMLAAKLRIATVILVFGSLVAGGVGLAAHQILAVNPTEGQQEVANPDEAAPHPSLPQVGEGRVGAEKQTRTDRYGDPLPEGAVARLGTVRFRNAEPYSSLAFTPDGKLLVSGGHGGACVWDAATGKESHRIGYDLPNPHGPAALSPDGKLVAVGGWGEDTGGAAVYELATARLLFRFGKPSQSVVPAFSPDGKSLAVYEGNPIIDLYFVATGERLRSIRVHEHSPDAICQVAGIAFTRDGKVLISAGGDGAIRFWDVATGNQVRQFSASPHCLSQIALSPDGSLLACTDYLMMAQGGGQTTWWTNNRVRFLDVASGKELRQIVVPSTSHTSEGDVLGPNLLGFTPDSKALLTGGVDGKLFVWDAASGKELRRFADHRWSLTAFAFAPDGKSFAIADSCYSVRVRDLATGKDLVPTGGHRAGLSAIAVSPDGRTVATGGGDRVIYLWDAQSGRELRKLEGHQSSIGILAFAGDGKSLFSSSRDKTLRVWNPATGREILRREGLDAAVRSLALSPDRKTLATAAYDKNVRLLDASTLKEIRTLTGPKEEVDVVSFTPDGRTLLALGVGQKLHQWDITTAKHQERPCGRSFKGGPYAVAFSPDRRFAAFAARDRSLPVVNVVNLATGRVAFEFPNRSDSPNDQIICVAFSPDGRTLAWGGPRDSLVRLGEVATGQERHRFEGHRGRVESVAFSADGRFLISGADDTTALVWDLTALPAEKQDHIPLSRDDLKVCWEELGSQDAMRAFVAQRRLIPDPAGTVPYLGGLLKPVTLDRRRMASLIADLDSDRFAVREKASQELEWLGELAEQSLRKALAAKPTLEARTRLEKALQKLDPVTSTKRLQFLRAVEVLEHIGTPEAQQILESLAKGAPDARLTQEAKASLDRLQKLAAKKP